MTGKKTVINTAGIVFLCLAYVCLLFVNRYKIGVIAAPVHVNIELGRDFMNDVNIETTPGSITHKLVPTTDPDPFLQNIVVHAELSGGKLIEGAALSIPENKARAVLSSIDNIGIFIGNKAFYFSRDEIKSLKGAGKGEMITYDISENLIYRKSFVKKHINWYGDYNFILKALFAPVMFPLRFLPLYLILFCLLLVRSGKGVKNINFASLGQWISAHEKIIFVLIVLLGLLLRLNGFVQYSAGGDEMSSAERSAPYQPLMLTFRDPGNPPFYYLLLKLWFQVFGWTEASGRLLSVIAGAAIVPAVYFMVKKYAGINAALLSSFAVAVSRYVIRVSHNTRGYIVVMFLVSLIAIFFLNIVKQCRKRDLALYTVFCMCLVNTHYYGVLFVTSNFLFFLAGTIIEKRFSMKKTLVFFGCNVLIALSLMPFMAITALNAALLSGSFNDWIPKLSTKIIVVVFAGVPLFSAAYVIVKKRLVKRNTFEMEQGFILDYCVFVSLFIFTQAFLISLVRPFLTLRYLSICSTFVIAGVVIFFSLNFKRRWLRTAGAVFCYLFVLGMYHLLPHTTFFDVSKEVWTYISADTAAHSGSKRYVLERYDNQEGYYKYKNISLYKGEKNTDLLYVSPVHCVEKEMYEEVIVRYNVDREHILKLAVDEKKNIWKKYYSYGP
jgi:hypothetical protein